MKNKSSQHTARGRWIAALTALLLLSLMGYQTSSAAVASDPLFVGDTPIMLTLNAPLRKITRDRGKVPDYQPGRLGHTDASGNETWFEVGVRARGKSRRNKESCRFPPLRINLKRSQAKNSLFAHQDKLKLVTHCKATARYEQYLLVEYLAYKILNLLTDQSFKVRLVTIHYLDGDKDLGAHRGFFIEHKDRLAERIEKNLIEPISITSAELEREQASIVELFQFMIGNTDFSLLKGPKGDVCCHNAVLFERNGQFSPIPYDFDSTGLVNPPYAVASESLNLKTLKQRRFRGFCRAQTLLEETVSRFQSRKMAIYELFSSQPGLTKRTSGKAKSYLDGFYRILDDPNKFDSKIARACR